MALSLIVAIAENNVIGKNNQLLWHLPKDLKFFKETTSGHPIIMGRKNFESIGKPLPHRKNIIITRDKTYQANGSVVVYSLNEALETAYNDNEEPFVIGGAEIYKLALPFVKTMYITHVHASFEGDTFFPPINWEDWNVMNETHFEPDEKNKFAFTIKKYVTKKTA